MLLSHIAESINQDSEELLRVNLELKRQKVSKTHDFECLTDLYKLSVSQDDLSPVHVPKDSGSWISTQRAKIREEMSQIQIEERHLDLELAALGRIHQKPDDQDGTSITRILLAKDAKDRKTQDFHNAEKRAQEFQESLLNLTKTKTHARDQIRKIENIAKKLPGLITSLRKSVPDASFLQEIEAETQTSVAAVSAILPRLATLDKDRTTLHESLQRKRKDWKQAESSLISQYEIEVSRLKSELEDLQKQAESGSREKSPIDSRKKSPLRGKDRSSAGEVQHLDLESLLGNASPSFQQIQTVTQQYRSGKDPGI